jgi:AcrR family transcriptional regulator
MRRADVATRNPRVRSRPPVRERVLTVAKRLFARYGYEHVSTAAIARTAGTSESQLFRHFASKADLLLAVFEEAWRTLNARFQEVLRDAPDVRVAATRILALFIEFFGTDPEAAVLMLLEGRRIRGDQTGVALSRGFREFTALVQRLIEQGQTQGLLPRHLNASTLASALIGAAEGMIRDWVVAQKLREEPPYPLPDVQTAFVALMSGLAAVARSSE